MLGILELEVQGPQSDLYNQPERLDRHFEIQKDIKDGVVTSHQFAILASYVHQLSLTLSNSSMIVPVLSIHKYRWPGNLINIVTI